MKSTFPSLLFISLIGVLLTSIGSLCAQTDTNPVQAKFICLGWSQVDVQGLFYQSGGEERSIKISSAYKSDSYSYTGPNPIVFYRQSTSEDGATVNLPVGSATLKPGQKDVLLLFMYKSGAIGIDATYNIVVIDNSPTHFPWGSYYIFNLSEHEVGGIIGKEKFIIPGKLFDIITPEEKDQVDVQIHFSQKIEDQWVPSVNTRWLYRQNARTIIFIIDDLSARMPRLKIKTVSQYEES